MTGCAAGTPLLHPAHVLRSGEVSMGAGVSDNFALGPAHDAILQARGATASGGAVSTPEQAQDFADGSIAYSLVTTGLAPWVGARVGTGYGTEAGLTYTGRSVRIDGRYAIENASTAVSFGAGASGILSHPSSEQSGATVAGNSDEIPGLDASGVSGWGVDVPIIAGYRSEADLVQVWGGARGGYEELGGHFTLRIDPDPTATRSAPVNAHRWYAGGLVGIAVGVAPLWVAAELDVGYQALEGSVAVEPAPAPARDANLHGVSLTPAGAVIAKF
jgi:hypothetical protein